MDWKKDWEEKVRAIKEQHPDLEVFGSRNKDDMIEAHRREGYEIFNATATDAAKLGKKLKEGGLDGSVVKCGDMIVMTRPKDMLKQELKELKEFNDKRAKAADESNRSRIRGAGLKDS